GFARPGVDGERGGQPLVHAGGGRAVDVGRVGDVHHWAVLQVVAHAPGQAGRRGGGRGRGVVSLGPPVAFRRGGAPPVADVVAVRLLGAAGGGGHVVPLGGGAGRGRGRGGGRLSDGRAGGRSSVGAGV